MRRIVMLCAGAVLAAALGGCSGASDVKPNADAAKREAENLKNARQKEWSGKK